VSRIVSRVVDRIVATIRPTIRLTTRLTIRNMSLLRLNKFLAEQGIASRREADRLIAKGLISVEK